MCFKACKGRPNKACCGCSTKTIIRLTFLLNITLFIATFFNLFRNITIDWSWFILLAGGISFVRLFFNGILCCAKKGNEIRARKNFMWIMILTSVIEMILLVV